MDLKEKILGSVQKAEAHGERVLHDVAGLTEQAKDTVIRDLRAVINDANDLLKQAQDTRGGQVGDMTDALNDGVSKLRHRFVSAHAALDTKARETRAAADRYVRQNPWQAVGIASAASLCVAVLLVGATLAPYFKKLEG